MREQTMRPRRSIGGEAVAFFQEVVGSRFDFSDIRATLPTHTFDRELKLNVGSKEVQPFELGPADTRGDGGDVVAYPPVDRTVYTGDIPIQRRPSGYLGKASR
jgi:cyclase